MYYVSFFRFEARSVSMFAESAASVQRVVLQLDLAAMEDDGSCQDDDGQVVVSLSPPSQSTLMIRRHRALVNSQSAARLRTCAPLVEVSRREGRLVYVYLLFFLGIFDESCCGVSLLDESKVQHCKQNFPLVFN